MRTSRDNKQCGIGLRLVRVVALAGLMLTGGLAAAAEPGPVLRENISINGDIVTLGDLFENAGAASDVAVFRSPDLGTKGIVSARRVKAAAKANGLLWLNKKRVDRLTVHRPSRVVTLEKLKNLVRRSVARDSDQAGVDDIQVTFDNRSKPVHLDPRNKAPLALENLRYAPSTGRFQATLSAGDDSLQTNRVTLRGRAVQALRVAVLRRDLPRGEIIEDGDVKLLRVPRSRLPRNYVAKRSGLIGLAARRRLSAGRAILKRDLERPKLVKKNMLVTVIYEIPGLILRAQGKALEGAGRGEVIRVKNTQSGKILHATVAGPGLVSAAGLSAGQPQIIKPRNAGSRQRLSLLNK